MALDGLRGWARKRVPLSEPKLAEVELGDSLWPRRSGHLVSLPLIAAPGLDRSVTVRLTTTCSGDLLLARPPFRDVDVTQLGGHAEVAPPTGPSLTRRGGSLGPTTDVWKRTDLTPPRLVPPGISDHSWYFDPLLSDVRVSGDLGLASTPVQVCVPAWETLTVPGCREEPFGAWQYPEVHDFLVALRRARCKGKAYATSAPDGGATGQAEQGRLWPVTEGSARVTQRREAAQRTEHAVRTATVDVFDLLLPFLYPPVDRLLEQPMLFPPDRRPYPYQIDGIRFLAGNEAALLGDEMGLGKTVQAIVAFQLLFRQGEARRAVIICPRSLLDTWQRELGKWAPDFLTIPVRGSPEQRLRLWQVRAPVLLTTYETLRDDLSNYTQVRNLFGEHKVQVAILDEVQKIKNPAAQISRSMGMVGTKYRWGLSGTPLENKVDDVVAIFRYLKPVLFRGSQPPYSPAAVKSAIRPHFLRRRTADVRPELPEKRVMEVWLELTDEQRRAYDLAERESRASLQSQDATRVHVFQQISRLKQICNLEERSGSSCKLDYLTEGLDEVVENGDKALVFSQYPKATLEKILPRLRRYDSAVYDGSLGDRQRQTLERSFQDSPSPAVLLMSVQAGGLGLTLHRANHVFHFDHWWNPAVARQAEGRAHRIGQSKSVVVHDIYTTDTIEERIYTLLANKQRLFDEVIDDMSSEKVQEAVTLEDLFGLFDLRPPEPPRDPVAATPRRPDPAAQHPPAGLPVAFARLSAREFEQLVAKLYTAQGYLATVTGGPHDDGIDVTARRVSGMGQYETVLIQCKHFQSGLVGPAVVREFVGVLAQNRTANLGVIITSGSFTGAAVETARDQRIRLVDGPLLRAMLRQYGLTT